MGPSGWSHLTNSSIRMLSDIEPLHLRVLKERVLLAQWGPLTSPQARELG
jgi:hypothetical protein